MKAQYWIVAILFIFTLASATLFLFDASEDQTIPADPQIIGYVGCSNTWQSVEGYHAVGGTQFWDVNEQYGGGNVTAWFDELPATGHWELVDSNLAEHPETNKIWWQLCIRQSQSTPYEYAEAVLAGIRDRFPDATIYVSPLAEYPDAVCGLTGRFGVDRSIELVEELLEKNKDLVAGPVLEPLTEDKTMPDHCHINEDSRPIVGQELKTFFD